MLACIWLPETGEAGAHARRLFAVSPLVEAQGEMAFLDDRGLARLHGGPAGLFAAVRRALSPHAARGLALASNRFTAEVAARALRRAVTVHPGEEALFLSRLPLSFLPMSAALARRLLPLGLTTLGDFASLPVASVERRYGSEGVALHRLARGEDRRALLPRRERGEPVVLQRLDEAAGRLPDLCPVLEAALARLVATAAEDGHGLLALQLRLGLDAVLAEDEAEPDEGRAAGRGHELSLVLSAPEDRVPLLVDLLRGKLEARPPRAAVTDVELRLLRSEPLVVHQNGLFGEIARDAGRRAEALSRLAALFGPAAVARPVPVRAHRLERRWELGPEATSGPVPDSRGPPDGPPLRVLAPPEELVPVMAGGTLVAFRRGAQRLEVARLSGPRRLVGGWWSAPWARDEYELLSVQGGRYRVVRDALARRWLLFAEGD